MSEAHRGAPRGGADDPPERGRRGRDHRRRPRVRLAPEATRAPVQPVFHHQVGRHGARSSDQQVDRARSRRPAVAHSHEQSGARFISRCRYRLQHRERRSDEGSETTVFVWTTTRRPATRSGLLLKSVGLPGRSVRVRPGILDADRGRRCPGLPVVARYPDARNERARAGR